MHAPAPAYWQCANPLCAFRFPDTNKILELAPQTPCPHCGGVLLDTGIQALHVLPPALARPADMPPMSLLLDNVRSAYNVGSIFRTADASGIQKLYLCGMTPTPAHKGVGKTALGAEESVAWEYAVNALGVAQQLASAGTELWALECTADAQLPWQNALPTAPLVLVVGNEVAGVDPQILALCQRKLYIPMWGAKESLNITVAVGVGIYALLQNRFSQVQSW